MVWCPSFSALRTKLFCGVCLGLVATLIWLLSFAQKAAHSTLLSRSSSLVLVNVCCCEEIFALLQIT